MSTRWKLCCGRGPIPWVVLTAIGIAVLWCPIIPLGVPGQWVWTRHAAPMDLWEWLDRFLPGCLVAAAFLAFARWGDRRLSQLRTPVSDDRSLEHGAMPQSSEGGLEVDTAEAQPLPAVASDDSQSFAPGQSFAASDALPSQGPNRPLNKAGRFEAVQCAALLTGLLVLTMSWQWAVQRSTTEPYRDVKPLWIVYDKYASGYFYEAVFHMDSADELLTGYEDRMREGDVLHIGTHPPGLFLISLAALEITGQSPGVVAVLESVRSSAAERAYRELEARAGLAPALSRSELAALQLVALLSSAFAALTVVPVFLLGRHVGQSQTGWRAACLYASIPAIAVFLPKSDVLYPLTMSLFLWLGCAAFLAKRTWTGFLSAIMAGGVLFAGMLLSLAHLPGVVVLGLFLGQCLWQRSAAGLRTLALRLTTMFLVWVVCIVMFSLTTGCDLTVVWKLNLGNHARFYDTSPRTWWKWTLVNPIELALSIGLPLFCLAGYGMRTATSRLVDVMKRQQPVSPSVALVVAAAVTLMTLWLSGKNMGEAARLWCFLMPWLTLAAGLGLAETSGLTDPSGGLPSSQKISESATWKIDRSRDVQIGHQLFVWVLGLQLLTAIATVSRVNGFSI